MPVNDPISDMLTRLRNASQARHDRVVLPASRVKVQILEVLKKEGFVGDVVQHEKKPQNEVTVFLKYGPERTPVLTGIRRVSKPGLRRYVPVRDIPSVLGGLGVAILSTSKGILADADARKQNVGGELICTIY
jgi:small subunit ribosomal protein S8